MNTLPHFVVMAAAFMGLSHIVPGISIAGWGTAFIASLILSAVGMVWKVIAKEEKQQQTA